MVRGSPLIWRKKLEGSLDKAYLSLRITSKNIAGLVLIQLAVI